MYPDWTYWCKLLANILLFFSRDIFNLWNYLILFLWIIILLVRWWIRKAFSNTDEGINEFKQLSELKRWKIDNLCRWFYDDTHFTLNFIPKEFFVLNKSTFDGGEKIQEILLFFIFYFILEIFILILIIDR